MASQNCSLRQNSLNLNSLKTWFSCSHKGAECSLRHLSPSETTVGYSPWPTGAICPPDTAAGAKASSHRCFRSGVLLLRHTHSFSVPEVYSCLSLLFLVQCCSFYGWTNAQHVSCSHFIHIFTVSSLTLYWFWFPRWRNSHCPFSSCPCRVTANRDESTQPRTNPYPFPQY